MATVLILATEPLIGGLLGQLTELAGHTAEFQCSDEEPVDAIHRRRPDIALVDAEHGVATRDRIASAVRGSTTSIIYYSTTMSQPELRRFALDRGAKYFPLPAGPRLLARVLASAMSPESGNGSSGSIGYCAVTAAVDAVTHARTLADRAETSGNTSGAERDALLSDCRRRAGELREAIIAYTRELRGAGVPPNRALEMIRDALRGDGQQRPVPELLRAADDATEWCLQTYYAA